MKVPGYGLLETYDTMCKALMKCSVWSDTLRPGGKKACPNLPLSPPQWTWPEVGGKEAPWMDGWGKRKGEDEVIEERELCCTERHDTAFSMWGQIKCGVKWKVFTLYLHSPLNLLSKRLQIYVTVSLCLLPALIMPFLFFLAPSLRPPNSLLSDTFLCRW